MSPGGSGAMRGVTGRIMHMTRRGFQTSGGRRKALENWKRPSIDELGVPKENWGVVNARTQKRYNLHLVAGLGVTSFTAAFIANVVDFNTTPSFIKQTGYKTRYETAEEKAEREAEAEAARADAEAAAAADEEEEVAEVETESPEDAAEAEAAAEAARIAAEEAAAAEAAKIAAEEEAAR